MNARFPLRFAVPALILAAGLAIIATAWIFEIRAQEKAIMELASYQMRSSSSLIAAEMESAFRNQRPSEARPALERAKALPHVRSIRVVSPSGQVLHDYTTGEGVSYLDRFDAIESGARISIADHGGVLVGRFPVRMWTDGGEIMPIRSGALYIAFDFTRQISDHRFSLAQRMAARTVVLFALAIGFWWMLRQLLLRPIDHLIEKTRQVSQGIYDVDFDTRGRDELSELSRELAEMTRSLRNHKEHLAYLSEHDALTGLRNREGIESDIEQALQETRTRNARFALILLDIDSLRVINDTQGHLAGDELLRSFSRLLADALPTALSIARVGGDEFAALIDTDHGEPIEVAGDRLQEHIRGFRFDRRGETFGIQATTGVVELSRDMENAEVALGIADAVCYRTKETDRGGLQIVGSDHSQINFIESSMRWVSQIQDALDNDRFSLFAQRIKPLQATSDEGLCFEVLLRMRDRNGDYVAPGLFLGAAERFNLIGRIDRWVLRNTLLWLDTNADHLSRISHCSINLSGISIGDQSLRNEIEAWLDNHPDFDPSIFCFEVTETAAIRNLEKARDFMHRMRALGCRFALDDFGTGLSSFEYIKHLPIDLIKIDGIFIREVLEDQTDHIVVNSINLISQSLGIRTVAEFVENKDIENELARMGIDYAQGYGIALPQTLDSILDHLIPSISSTERAHAFRS